MIWLVTSIANGDIDILPHWLKHYESLGIVDRIVLCVAADCPSAMGAQSVASQVVRHHSIKVNVAHISLADTLTLDQHKVQKSMCGVFGAKEHDWCMIADLDEFYEMPAGWGDHTQFVTGYYRDMVAVDGSLPSIRQEAPMSEQFPIATHLTRDFQGGPDQKIMLHRFFDDVSEGHHQCRPMGTFSAYAVQPPFGIVRHYKWKAGMAERLRQRMANPANCSPQNIRESQKLLDMLDANGGKLEVKPYLAF